ELARCAYQDVGPAVAVDVAQTRDRPAELIARRGAGEGVQQRSARAGPDVHTPRLRAVRPFAEGPGREVVAAVAVDVSHARDGEAQAGAGRRAGARPDQRAVAPRPGAHHAGVLERSDVFLVGAAEHVRVTVAVEVP